MFRLHELIPMIHKCGTRRWKRADIAERIGVCSKQYYYLERNLVVPKNEMDLEIKLGDLLFKLEGFEVPWTIEAQRQVIVIRNMARNNMTKDLFYFGTFSIRKFVEELRGLNIEDIEPTKELWGKALVAFFFVSAMRHSEEDLDMKCFSRSDLVFITNILLKLLQSIQNQPWAVLLGYTLHQIRMAERWNSADSLSNERRSEEMRFWLEETRKRFIEYNDLVPFVYEAPFSALTNASRFEERDSYIDLLTRIMKAKRFGSLYEAAFAVLDDNDADEDFKDFSLWVEEYRDILYEKKVA